MFLLEIFLNETKMKQKKKKKNVHYTCQLFR